MFIKKKLKYFTRPKQISPDLSGVSGDFRIVWNDWSVNNFKIEYADFAISHTPKSGA